MNDVDHRAFIEEEQRRQEVARQRLAHASSLATSVLGTNSNSSTNQRRSLSRQSALRLPRGFRSILFSHLIYRLMHCSV